MSFVDRTIILCPSLVKSAIGGFTVLLQDSVYLELSVSFSTSSQLAKMLLYQSCLLQLLRDLCAVNRSVCVCVCVWGGGGRNILGGEKLIQ